MEKIESGVVVRFRTAWFTRGKEIVYERTVRVMKSLTTDKNHAQLFIDDSGEDMSLFVPNYPKKDGLYDVIFCPDSTDFETGHIDEWHYEFKERL